MVSFRLRRVLLCIFVYFFASGCVLNSEASSRDLEKFPKANENLFKTLRCLHGKVYPEDIDKCGVGIFASESQLDEIEICLGSYQSRQVRLLVKKPLLVGLFADCKSGRVMALFKKLGDDYVVDSINFLME